MITCWPSLYRPGEGRLARDRALYARGRAPRAHLRSEDVPRWAGAEFRDGYRDLAHFVRAWWLALDFDKGTTAEQLVKAFGDLCGFTHTTWRSTGDRRRSRVALQLSRPVDTIAEWDRVWRAGAALAERHGLEPDFAARAAAHCFALPARHDGDAYEYAEFTGALFDVGQALEEIPAEQPLPEPEARARNESYSRRLLRASRYLEQMPGAIAGSGGHVVTFRAAVAMVRGFGLDPDDAFRLLLEVHNPVCKPEWNQRELRHKVRQAFQRARLPFGAIADRPLERRAG